MLAAMGAFRRLSLCLLLVLPLAVSACGGDDAPSDATGSAVAAKSAPAPGGEAALAHIHGLGVEPGSRTLYVATHFGLFQAAKGEVKLKSAGPSRQDIMGFSVLGPRRFIGSGHPAPTQNLPPNLGLIQSRDRGGTWRDISLSGQADFHVLRSAGGRVYGVDSSTGKMMVSPNGGRDWSERTPPAGIIDLAIDPTNAQRIVASTERGLFASQNAGEGWRPLGEDTVGLVAWPTPRRLFLIDAQGQVFRSADAGKHFDGRGSIGGQPAAFISDRTDLYAALGDGRVMRSSDGGTKWAVRATP